MIKHPDKDWRLIMRRIVAAPAEERAAIFKEALGTLNSEEERVMTLVELQKIFGNGPENFTS